MLPPSTDMLPDMLPPSTVRETAEGHSEDGWTDMIRERDSRGAGVNICTDSGIKQGRDQRNITSVFPEALTGPAAIKISD